MVLRGIVEHHARLSSNFGATVARIESIVLDVNGVHSVEGRVSHPNVEIHVQEARKREKYHPRRISRVAQRARFFMSNDTWPYSLSRRRIKRSRKKTFVVQTVLERFRRSFHLRLTVVGGSMEFQF